MSRIGATLALCLLLQGASQAMAEVPGSAADSPEPLPTFHRLFLPDSEIERRDWKHRYLPVDAAEFERDLKVVADHHRGAPSADKPRLVKATYFAQLIGEDLLVGTAQLTVAGDLKLPTMLPLGVCSLAIESAHWPGADQPATLALDASGKLQLLVEDKRLDLRWSQRGQRTASGAVQFELKLPPSLVGNLELTVPVGAEIVAEGGIVTRQVEPSGENSPSAARWGIELGGTGALRLRVVPKESAGQRRPLTLLRQSTTYEFSARGINVATQLRLDVHGEPLERLKIDLDPTLHLISAKTGDLPIPWSSATDVDSGETHVILEFQEPLSGTGRVIQLASVSPLVTGESAPLPRVLPRQVAWQEGTANLLVPAALVLERLKTSGCRQSRVTTLPAPLTGESIEIQFYESEGRIETRVAEPQQRLSLRCAHQVEIAPDSISTSSVFDLGSDHRSAKVLELRPRAGWIVDSVQSVKGTENLTWDIEEKDSRSILRIHPAAAQRIIVRAHAPLGDERPLPAAAVRAFDPDSFNVASEILSVQGTGGLEVRWQSEFLHGRAPNALSAEELQLFVQAPAQTVVLVDDRVDDARLSIEQQRPEFTADLHVDVAVQGPTLTETLTILCTPAASRVDRLLVHLSEKHDENVKWSLAGGNSGDFSARRLSAGEQTKLGLPNGEVWELLLKLTRLGTFEVRGQRRVPFTAESPVSLACVPGAANQHGTVAIRALGETGLAIQNRSLTSVPAEALDDENYQTARAAFHYPPAADDFASQPALVLVPGAPLQASTGAWIWSLKLVSRFDSEARMSHQAVAEIQTAGRRHVELKLPLEASLNGVWLDDLPVAQVEFGKLSAPLKIQLPPGKSRGKLAIHYSTSAELPVLARKFAPPFPTLDAPVVHRCWQLWLPPGHVVGDATGWMSPTQLVPLTWSERLFGILGRSAGQNLFNPLVASDWRDNFASGADVGLARDRALQFLATVGDLLTEYRDAEELAWGQLLASVGERQGMAGAQILVDSEALAAAGIGPLTRMPVLHDDTETDRASLLLKNAGLVILVTPEQALLTSSATAAGFDPRRFTTLGTMPAAVARGALSGQLRSISGQEGTVLSVASWLANSDPTLVGGEGPLLSSAHPVGWRRYDLQCHENRLGDVRIVHSSRMQSLAWAIFLGAAGLCLWRPVLPGSLLIILASLLVAVALVVPASFTPLAAASLLGVLIGLLARMTAISHPGQPDPSDAASRGSQSKYVQPVVSALILAAIVNGAAALDAAEPNGAPSSTPEAEPLYTVLFPIDEERQPTGSKVFVPEPLYEKLLKEAAAASGRPQGWLISRAEYEGSVSRDGASAGNAITAFKARFDINVFQSNAPVRLPFAHDGWQQAVGSARLDGKSLTLNWQDEDGVLVGPLSVGRHVLEVDLRPTLVGDTRSTGVDLPIPRVAQAILRLSGAVDLENIKIISARGRVTLDAQRDSLVAQLGAADRLAIRWPTAQSNSNPAAVANLQVDELVWVRVRPGTTVLDARLKFQINSGELRTVRLATDPRLRLLTSPVNGSLLAAVRTFPGSPQIIELDLIQPARDSVTLDVSFLVADASGVGNLRLPQLESIDAKPLRRWLGVSVDPALQYRIQAGEDSPSVDIAKFLESWGIGDAKPLAAFAISRGEPIWFLATQPAEPKVSVQQKTVLSVGRRFAQVRIESSLDITAGVLAQLTMASHPDFQPDRISMLDQDVERVARWSVSDEGELNIFLTTPIAGRQQLVVTGRWPLPASAGFEAPRWSLQSATVNRGQWEFYRQNEVLLTISPPAEARPPELPSEPLRSGLGSLAAVFQADTGDLAFGLQVAENDPRVNGATVTSVRREGDRFLANIDYQVEVAEGILDSLQFEIPAQLVGPFRTEPAAIVTLGTAAATQRRVLTLTPTTPLTGKHAFRIQGRIAPSPGDRLRVPDVQPLAVESLDRFVLLPKQLDSQPVSWETSRLTAAKLPAELLPRGWNPEAVSSYKVHDDGFHAVLKSVDRADAAAVVQLADIHLAWSPTGDWQAAATYDLQPGGATECELQLPPGCELIHATVEHLPASLVELGQGKFRLTLGPQNLPQRVEVLYTTRPEYSAQQTVLTAPRLGSGEPLQTLWTIYHLPADRVEPLEQRIIVSASDQQLVRLTSASRLVDLSADVLGEHLPEEISRWYGNWRQRYWKDRLTLRRSLIAAGRDPTNSEEAAEARSLDQKMIALDDRLGANNSAAQSASTHDFVQAFVETAGAGLARRHYSLKATDGAPVVRYQSYARGSQWRWMSATGLMIFGCVVGWRFRGRELPQFPPVVLATCVAAFWWLFLGTSMWGLLAVVLILLTWLWKRNPADA